MKRHQMDYRLTSGFTGSPMNLAAGEPWRSVQNYGPMKPLLIIFLLLLALPVSGKVFQPSIPARYVKALQIADTFLWAWVHRDADTGLKLISHGLLSKLKQKKKEEWFKQYMIGLSNPHHCGTGDGSRNAQ